MKAELLKNQIVSGYVNYMQMWQKVETKEDLDKMIALLHSTGRALALYEENQGDVHELAGRICEVLSVPINYCYAGLESIRNISSQK